MYPVSSDRLLCITVVSPPVLVIQCDGTLSNIPHLFISLPNDGSQADHGRWPDRTTLCCQFRAGLVGSAGHNTVLTLSETGSATRNVVETEKAAINPKPLYFHTPTVSESDSRAEEGDALTAQQYYSHALTPSGPYPATIGTPSGNGRERNCHQ